MILFCMLAMSQTKKVLIYGPLLSNTPNEATIATSLGYTVDIKTDAQWAAKTQAQFSSYNVIVIPDDECQSYNGNTNLNLQTLDNTKSLWSQAVQNGRKIILGSDAMYHYHQNQASAGAIVKNSIEWIAQAGCTGLYYATGCNFINATSFTPISFLSLLGNIEVTSARHDNVNYILPTHPVMIPPPPIQLDNWYTSIHANFKAPLPIGFYSIADDANTGNPFLIGAEATCNPLVAYVNYTCSDTACITVAGGCPPYNYAWCDGSTTSDTCYASTWLPKCLQCLAQVMDGCGNLVQVVVENPDISITSTHATNPAICDGVATVDNGCFGQGCPYTNSYLWSHGATTQTATGLCCDSTYTVTVTNCFGNTWSCSMIIDCCDENHKGLRHLPGLQSITVYEKSGANSNVETFTVNSAELINQLPGQLTIVNKDFGGSPNYADSEYYDIFYSDKNGDVDTNGCYLTIECSFNNTASIGGNIQAIKLNTTNGTSYACKVVGYQIGTYGSVSSINNALNNNLTNWTSMGNTTGLQRTRVTVRFCVDELCRCKQCDTVCTDFSNGVSSWAASSNQPGNYITSTFPGPSGVNSDNYLRTNFYGGGQYASASPEYYGSWCCGALCYDFKIFEDGNCIGLSNFNPKIEIRNGTKGFVFTSSQIANELNGWHSICAPVSNSQFDGVVAGGTWVPLPGTSGNLVDWLFVLNNITSVRFLLPDACSDLLVNTGIDNVCFMPGKTIYAITQTPCTDELCIKGYGCNDGYAGLIWSNGATASCITALSGTHTATVTDLQGNATTFTATIQPKLHVICFDGEVTNCLSNKGAVSGTITGGVGLKSVTLVSKPSGNIITTMFVTGNFSPYFSNLSPGEYCIIVSDENGCIDSCCCVLRPYAWQTLHLEAGIFCNATGGISVVGQGTYTYLWSNGLTTAAITGLTAGQYSVTITNTDGCTQSLSTMLYVSNALNAMVNTISPSTCSNPASGIIRVTGSGGTPISQWSGLQCYGGYGACHMENAYNYAWSNGSTMQQIENLTHGTYTVIVTDANGCTVTASATITNSNNIDIEIPWEYPCIVSPGQATANVTGGTAPYAYAWSNGATTQQITNLTAGTYTVTVTDANGCDATNSVTIAPTNPQPAIPALINGPVAICKNGTYNFSTPILNGITTYNWTVGSGTTITSGQGTNTITVYFGNNALSSSIKVSTSTACGTSAFKSKSYKVSTVPNMPSNITGPAWGVCKRNNVTYSVATVSGATGYTWIVPSGVSIVSGQGTKTIVVNFSQSFTGTGQISVSASNNCGAGATRTLTVKAVAATPIIQGSNSVCMYQQGVVYSVAPVYGATSYTWTVVPGSTIVSGQGTNSIIVNWGNINGLIKCKAVNTCGNSTTNNFAVSFVCRENQNEALINTTVSPNPATTELTVTLDSYANAECTITIFNMMGQAVYHKAILLGEGNNEFKINVESLARGSYVLQLNANDKVTQTKVVLND